MSIDLELHVPDFTTAKAFYGVLGFETLWESANHGGYLVMQRDGDKIAFYGGSAVIEEQSYFKSFPRDTKRGYGVEICLTVKDIEQYYHVLNDALEKQDVGGRLVTPLKMRPWGVQDFRLEDPFGFYLRVSAPYDLTTPT